MTHRVVQWTTGNVGRQSVAAIVAHPDLELVGCYAWSPDKVGTDVGDLCGIGSIGVPATDDVDALLALKPDCVVYNPMWVDVDDMVRILEAGSNIVSTAAFITGHSLGDGRRRIAEACERGGASVFGSGINPGSPTSSPWCARACATASTRSRSPRQRTPRATTPRPPSCRSGSVAPSTIRLLADDHRRHGGVRGRGAPAGRCARRRLRRGRLRGRVRGHHRGPGPRLVADREGCVAGIAASWHGRVGGRTIVELRVRWRKGQSLDPDWQIDSGYLIEIDGRPMIRTKVDILPPPDFEATTFEDFMVLGMILTAMPAINAIPRGGRRAGRHRHLHRPPPAPPAVGWWSRSAT